MTVDIKKNHLIIHFIYCVAILLFCIVLISTDRWSDKENFTTYLTNAATLVSLVLGLVAIFYSFISNLSLSQGLGSISSVAHTVQQSGAQLDGFLRQAQALNDSVKMSSSEVREVGGQVDESVNNLKATMHSLGVKTDELHEIIREIPGKMNDLETSFKSTQGKDYKKSDGGAGDGHEPDEELILEIIKKSSLALNLLMYACVLAQKYDKVLSLAEFRSTIKIGTPVDYFQGYFSAMVHMNVVDREVVSSRSYKVLRINSAMKSAIKPELDRYIASGIPNNELWRDRVRSIEEMFEDPL